MRGVVLEVLSLETCDISHRGKGNFQSAHWQKSLWASDAMTLVGLLLLCAPASDYSSMLWFGEWASDKCISGSETTYSSNDALKTRKALPETTKKQRRLVKHAQSCFHQQYRRDGRPKYWLLKKLYISSGLRKIALSRMFMHWRLKQMQPDISIKPDPLRVTLYPINYSFKWIITLITEYTVKLSIASAGDV